LPRLYKYPLLLLLSITSLWLVRVFAKNQDPPSCPRLMQLPRLCVPLPESKEPIKEVGPEDSCAEGYFDPKEVDIRRLFSDTILLKETNDPTYEKPVIALFLGETKALLYDTGNDSIEIQEVIAPLLQGRALEVLNTHLHGDHIARNQVFSLLAIETPEVDEHCGLDDDDFHQNEAPCQNPKDYTPPEDQMLFGFRSFQVSRVVRDGYQLDLGGRQILVLETPGHSETSITLYDKTHQLLFTGDTLYPGDNPPLIHPEVGSSFGAYLTTAQRYLTLSPKIELVIGAHGEGVMPVRSLQAFFDLVEARYKDPDKSPTSVVDPLGCPSGNFTMGSDPARP
jgi:glyoxylase-like metal-dependent hydrolase (beta-lactamase superfamily II)